jgi:flagellar biosynthesis/type III secretory pathway M-ring protein FliF/YscJ
MELLLAIVLLVFVAFFVSRPLLRPEQPDEDPRQAERAELEARKQAKYREIRDAEADRASGKLTEQDFGRINRELRGEAIEILKRIDHLGQG